MITVEPYARHWAVYEGDELVCVCVYKKGAEEVKRRLAIAEAKPLDELPNVPPQSEHVSEASAPQRKETTNPERRNYPDEERGG